MSLTTRVFVALIAGIGTGLLLSAGDASVARTVISVIEPIGTLFVNAIRMTVIPLVFSLLIVGIASAADVSVIARLGWRAAAVFVSMLIASGVAGALVAQPIFSRIPLDPAAIAAVRASAGATDIAASAQHMQSFGEWLVALVPANPTRAAADGAMLPLIVFAVAMGAALLVVPDARRRPVVAFFDGVAEAMLVLVRWILVAAPIGVFALVLPLVARLGASAVRALASYVIVVSAESMLFLAAVVYPAVRLLGRIPIVRFARAAAAGQAVALSSRSSLAALPALIDGARSRLGMTEETAGFLLPLASAAFRVGAAGGLTIGAIFLGHLYGSPLSLGQIATVIVTAVLTSFSIPGVPGGSIIAMVPVLSSVGLPLQGLGILLGVDTIPDSFRTTANVTGQIAAAAMVAGAGVEGAGVS